MNTKEDFKLSYDQATFLMECMRYYVNNEEFDYTDEDGNVILTSSEMNQLFLDIQNRRY